MELNKQKAALVKTGFWLMSAVGIYLCIRFLLPCSLPFLVGFAIAYMLRPVVGFLHRHSGIRRHSASIVAAVIFYAALLIALWAAGAWACSWLRQAGEAFPQVFSQRVTPFLTELLQRLEGLQSRIFSGGTQQQAQQLAEGLQKALADLLGSVSGWCMELMGKALQAVPGFVVAVIFAVMASVLISSDYEAVTGFVMRQVPKRMHKTLLEARDFLVGTLLRMLRAYLILMAVTFGFLAVGLWVLRTESPLAMAALIAVLDLLPVIGSGAVLIPWGIYALLGGEYFLGAGLFILWALLSAGRQVLEPKIVGDQIGLHPLASLAAMYAGLKLAGLAGLITAPILCLLLGHLHGRGVIRLSRPA